MYIFFWSAHVGRSPLELHLASVSARLAQCRIVLYQRCTTCDRLRPSSSSMVSVQLVRQERKSYRLIFSSSVLQSPIQQWTRAPYCWSVTVLLTIWPWVQGSFESFWWWGRTDGQRQFIPVANGSRKEGVFIECTDCCKRRHSCRSCAKSGWSARLSPHSKRNIAWSRLTSLLCVWYCEERFEFKVPETKSCSRADGGQQASQIRTVKTASSQVSPTRRWFHMVLKWEMVYDCDSEKFTKWQNLCSVCCEEERRSRLSPVEHQAYVQ